MKPFLLSAAIILLLHIRCARAESTVDDSALGAIDPVTESRLGNLWVQEELNGYKLSTNQEQIRAVNEIGNRILGAINDRPELDDWKFIVVDAAAVNAVSFPGGRILVFTGLIDLITTDGRIDQGMLAGVIGHEIAHAKLHHSLKGLRDRNALNWALANMNQIENSDSKNELSEAARQKFFALTNARFTREQEFEADMMGSFYAAVAGYGYDGNIRWAQRAIEKLGDQSPTEYLQLRTKGGNSAALDHPTWSERIAKMKIYQERMLNIAGEFNWGSEMLYARNFEKATECFRDVVKTFPKCFQAWNNLGIAYQMQFLQEEKPDELKFQTDLVDYLIDLRERMRGTSDYLALSINCFREALRQNPRASGVRANLATALALQAMFGTVDKGEPLTEAEKLFDSVIAEEPANVQALNGKGIVLCTREPKSTVAEEFLSKAASQDYLPAQYNLARLRLDLGKEKEAVAGLVDYLGKDASSVWAVSARQLLKSRQVTAPPAKSKLPLHLDSVLQVPLDATREDVLRKLKEPERREKINTSDDSTGEILWYDSLGLSVVLSETAVKGFTIFQPGMPHSTALPGDAMTGAPEPEIAGVSIGETVEQLQQALGNPAQISFSPGSAEKLYSYTGEHVRIDFRTNLGRVFAITISKKT